MYNMANFNWVPGDMDDFPTESQNRRMDEFLTESKNRHNQSRQKFNNYMRGQNKKMALMGGLTLGVPIGIAAGTAIYIRNQNKQKQI